MKFKALLCCERTKPYLFNQNIYEFYESKYITSTHKFHEKQDYLLNGKIILECDFEVEEIEYITEFNPRAFAQDEWFVCKNNYDVNLLKESCLSITDLCKYFKNTLEDDTCGYAIHIKNLHIFDKPRELNFYMVYDKSYDNMFGWAFEEEEKYKPLTKAPRNMMYVYDNEEKKILIPVSSEEMCRIANKEQTILVRKRVLKEVIK